MQSIFNSKDIQLLRLNTKAERFLSLREELLRHTSRATEEDLEEENPAFHQARRILLMALVYLIEADRNCGEIAKDFILELVTFDSLADWMRPFHRKQHPTMLSDLHVAEISINLVLASEALSELLSARDKELIEAGLMERAVELILTEVERSIWWTEAYNCNWCSLMYSALGLTSLYLREVSEVSLAEGRIRKALLRTGEPSLKFHPFWKRALDFPLSFLMPDLKGWPPFSDTPYEDFHHQSLLYWLAGRLWELGDEEGAKKAQWLGDKIREVNQQRADPLSPLWRRKKMEPPVSSSPLSKLRLSGQAGREDVSFSYLKAGPTIPLTDTSTFFRDENSRRSSPSACKVEEFRHCEFTALLSADATSAYSGHLEQYHRHLFWFPDIVAVLDDIIVKDREIRRDLALHYHTPCGEGPPSPREEQGDGRGAGSSLF